MARLRHPFCAEAQCAGAAATGGSQPHAAGVANHRLGGFPTHQLRHTRAAQMLLEGGEAQGEARGDAQGGATVALRQRTAAAAP